MTPRKFGILSTISQKPIKPETSNLADSFILAPPTKMEYNIGDRGRGLGHVTNRIFGIPSSISPKPVKLESSKLVHRFNLAHPRSLRYKISERGRGLGYVLSLIHI